MTRQDFIDENEQEICACIRSVVPNCEIDNDEIEMWLANDEGLYNWAIDSGVDIEDL